MKTPYTSDESIAAALRPAASVDCDIIATIWHSGWRDGHIGNVPTSIHRHRRPSDFRRRVPARLAETTVVTIDSRVVGFVMVHDDEIEQIYVAAASRGAGVATALLEHAEQLIARRFDVAWLAVVAGNSRARRFYERSGWTDRGPIDYAAPIEGGTALIPSRRYEKGPWRQH